MSASTATPVWILRLLSRKPHPSQVKHARLIAKMESCWKEDSQNSSVALFTAISQVSIWYLCAWGIVWVFGQAVALIADARQATDDRKSGSVKIGLTGLVATVLLVI